MNIPSIMGVKLVTPNYETPKQNNTTRFGLKMSSPLNADTVSFTGTPKNANKMWEITRADARAIRRAKEAAFKRVRNFMDQNFGDLVATEKYPKNPLLEIAARLKSDLSIQEKTGSRKWVKAEEIATEMTDLIGAKLVFRDATKPKVDMVLDRFIQLIKNGKIELLEIENKRPIVVKDLPEYQRAKYDYASMDMYKKMIAIQNDIWKKGGSKQRVKRRLEDDFTDANYCATHYLFRLPGRKPITFELQVLGNDVNAAKHIDDFVFKKLDGKNPQGCPPEFDKIFEPFTNKKFFEEEPNAKEIVENAKEKLDKYRGEVFLFQRDKEPIPYTKKKRPEMFLPLSFKLFPSDIEIKYGISSLDFDYNNLNRILQRKSKKVEKHPKVQTKTQTENA